jgi:formate-dependent nitrite reductase membrane component NrfD
VSDSHTGAPGNGGESQGREALVGKGTSRRKARRRRGEKAMVSDAEFTSYYGKPVLKPPTWKPLDIAGYFFLGGLAGAGSVFAAGAEITGRPRTARALKISSLVAVTGSLVALVHDLGRPDRFLNMLRVVKPTSPMSVGSWVLTAYAPVAGAAAVLDVTGWFPRLGRGLTAGAAALGPVVATYTAVLASDTAVPAWHGGYRELPFVFAGSATAAASGVALIAAPARENAPARSAGIAAAALEIAATKVMERRLGMVGETYHTGKAGWLMRAATALSAAGAAGAALLGGRSRTAAVLGGVALLTASACTRFGVFQAGLRSAEDPKYTVVPQRRRLETEQGPTDDRGGE